MTFDPISWALGYTAKKGADYALGITMRDDLRAKMRVAAETWRDELPEELWLNNPAGLFRPLDTVDPGQRVHLDKLRNQLSAGHIPDPELWTNAFHEQVIDVRNQFGKDAVSFVVADDEVILPHLNDLAHRLTAVLTTDHATILPAIYNSLCSLHARINDLESQLESLRGPM